MSVLPVPTRSVAYGLQTTWMLHAFNDACMFHATMFAASAHLDAFRDKRNNVVTMYHQTETIRLVKERLLRSERAVDDVTIAAVIPLAFFAVVAPNPSFIFSSNTLWRRTNVKQYIDANMTASLAHFQGLLKMIQARGGLEKLGLDGLLAGLARLYVKPQTLEDFCVRRNLHSSFVEAL
jgi:hypothetical protein